MFRTSVISMIRAGAAWREQPGIAAICDPRRCPAPVMPAHGPCETHCLPCIPRRQGYRRSCCSTPVNIPHPLIAVAAYGWPADHTDKAVLKQFLALSQAPVIPSLPANGHASRNRPRKCHAHALHGLCKDAEESSWNLRAGVRALSSCFRSKWFHSYGH